MISVLHARTLRLPEVKCFAYAQQLVGDAVAIGAALQLELGAQTVNDTASYGLSMTTHKNSTSFSFPLTPTLAQHPWHSHKYL